MNHLRQHYDLTLEHHDILPFVTDRFFQRRIWIQRWPSQSTFMPALFIFAVPSHPLARLLDPPISLGIEANILITDVNLTAADIHHNFHPVFISDVTILALQGLSFHDHH